MEVECSEDCWDLKAGGVYDSVTRENKLAGTQVRLEVAKMHRGISSVLALFNRVLSDAFRQALIISDEADRVGSRSWKMTWSR